MGASLFQTVHPDWRADKANQVRRACAEGSDALVYVAEVGDDRVGFATCYADRRTGVGEIGNNAVHPRWQGLGIGPRLYERVFAVLADQGMRFVKVETGGDPAHARARQAYYKAGFGVALPCMVYYREL